MRTGNTNSAPHQAVRVNKKDRWLTLPYVNCGRLFLARRGKPGNAALKENDDKFCSGTVSGAWQNEDKKYLKIMVFSYRPLTTTLLLNTTTSFFFNCKMVFVLVTIFAMSWSNVQNHKTKNLIQTDQRSNKDHSILLTKFSPKTTKFENYLPGRGD